VGQNPPPTFVTRGGGTCHDSGRGGTEPDRRPPAARASLLLAGLRSVVPEHFHGSMRRPFAMRAMLSIETFALRALDTAEVGSVDAALVRERLLAEPALGGQPAHGLGQGIPKRKRQSSIAAAILGGGGEYEPPLALALCLG
jgi:hypothetical protein